MREGERRRSGEGERAGRGRGGVDRDEGQTDRQALMPVIISSMKNSYEYRTSNSE